MYRTEYVFADRVHLFKGSLNYLLFITSAPITPGTQPQQVSRVTMTIEPQPLSSTASGGEIYAQQDAVASHFLSPKSVAVAVIVVGKQAVIFIPGTCKMNVAVV